MTIVVAAKKNGKVVMGADSLTTIGDKKMIRLKNKSKLFKFSNFVVGMAGMGPLVQVLERMSSPDSFQKADSADDESKELPDILWNDSTITNSLDCALFLQAFMSVYSEIGEADDMESIELLICTPDKIFCTNGESEAYEIEDFWAVGSGAPYALGSLESTFGAWNSDETWLEERVSEAVEVACKYSTGCEPPIEVINLNTL